MKQTQGTPLPLGVTGTDKGMNFAVAVPQGDGCWRSALREAERYG